MFRQPSVTMVSNIEFLSLTALSILPTTLAGGSTPAKPGIRVCDAPNYTGQLHHQQL